MFRNQAHRAALDPPDPLEEPMDAAFVRALRALESERRGARQIAVVVDLAQYALGPDVAPMAGRIVAALTGYSALAERTLHHVAPARLAFLAPPGTDALAYAATIEAALPELRQPPFDHLALALSVGLAEFRIGETDPAEVLARASAAAQDARSEPRSVCVASRKLEARALRRFILVEALVKALVDANQLRLAFQPSVDLRSGRCVGAQAQLRWRHPTLGKISPAEFLPLLDHATLIRPFTAWIAKASLLQLVAWEEAGIALALSIKLPAASLDEPRFAERLGDLVRQLRVPAGRLELQFSEPAILAAPPMAIAQLEALREGGIAVAIGDFGMGCARLSSLRKLPANAMRIHANIVAATADEAGRTLVREMMLRARELGMRTVAEGVECAAAHERMHALGCGSGLGSHFAPPLELAEFTAWLDERAELSGAGPAEIRILQPCPTRFQGEAPSPSYS